MKEAQLNKMVQNEKNQFKNKNKLERGNRNVSNTNNTG